MLAPIAFERATPGVIGYAILSLTLIRGAPVALSLAGRGLRGATVVFLAWFGPRGIASILFALLVVERSHLPFVDDVVAVVATTVLLSVMLHGMSAAPAAAWYSRRVARSDMADDCSEKQPVEEMPLRADSTRTASG